MFKDFQYRTLKSWTCTRRVIGKAEFLDKGENPRFVVTSLSRIRLTVRNIWISMSEAYPYAEIFALILRNLQALPLRC